MVTFLNQECDVFSDFGNVSKLTQAFPYLTRLMSELLTFHSTKFLPPHLTEFVFSLVNLRESFDIKAEKCAVKALRDFEVGKAYAVRIKHTSVFDKAKNCCSIFSYEKVCLFVCCLFGHLPKKQIHEIEGFEFKDFTFLSNDKLLELRGTRPRTNKGYSVSTPSKMAFL